jgi:hypothetical protein
MPSLFPLNKVPARSDQAFEPNAVYMRELNVDLLERSMSSIDMDLPPISHPVMTGDSRLG